MIIMNLFIILLTFVLAIILIAGLVEPSNVIMWGCAEDRTRKNVFKYFGTSLLICLVLSVVTHNMVVSAAQKEVQTQKTIQEKKQAESLVYKPTTEESQVLKKTYEKLEGKDYTTFSDLDKKYDSMSESQNKNIKTDMERLRKEKNDYLEESKKQSEQNKQLYTVFTKEIESSYPSMKVSSISGKDKTKSLDIYMTLLNNLDATYYECAKLTLDKESKMKEIGINSIMIYVKNKDGENQGILSFELKNGRYESKINTFTR